ncbi:MAG: bifunctional phosphopantothenoylcysteine decarboxylase/phosphopantothenate--cysteine ligase CoaBC [Prevotellaceae bacterium]|jgi:phosphopantothenoylcysteine decarboxylase/phosphopantothenate--cysteine ligase|nr:bifunctional phosphopantothenoylcysteine decarboxylase/phosphopantothenate--cysteine ligase CoaBC [Prevotellaceae bacterium]
MNTINNDIKGKKILLGVTGSIAAYKAAALVRLLVKEGAEVKVLMTSTAKQFITPLTMATLSKNPVQVEFFNPENGEWNSHVKLGLWADLMLVAPASANTIGKMACGIADNLLLTTYLSARCPVVVAPAMDADMYAHVAHQQNLALLRLRGVHVIEPSVGELASGLQGQGRMEEPEEIVRLLQILLEKKVCLSGKHFLVTAGPTYESIDAVRFIGNISSGKMGYAIAEELAWRGARVTLISGPVHVVARHPKITLYKVSSAQEMYEAAARFFPDADGAVMAAAVADFTPESKVEGKLKRGENALSITLTPTKDIAAYLGSIKKENQTLVGFALEVANEHSNALKKLREKNLDLIVLNSLNDANAGFNFDTNKVCIIDRTGKEASYALKSKVEVAKDIVDTLSKWAA